jgi:ABC-type transporter Mla subunit MlaD
MEAEQQAATSRIQSLQEEIEQAREQQQALIDQSFLPYQQHVDEALAKLERRIVSEVSQRQEQLAKMSEQIEGTSQQLALCIQTTNQYQQELAAQLGQIRQRNEQLEQTVHEQGLRLAWVESLEQTVAEQGKQLARYEQLLQLPDRLETLYRELVNRNLLRTEKNEQGTC